MRESDDGEVKLLTSNDYRYTVIILGGRGSVFVVLVLLPFSRLNRRLSDTESSLQPPPQAWTERGR